MMRWKIIGHPRTKEYFMLHKVFYCAKNSNKQSAKLNRFDRLRTVHRKMQKVIYEHWSAAHKFNSIVLRVNPGLTSCEEPCYGLESPYSVKMDILLL